MRRKRRDQFADFVQAAESLDLRRIRLRAFEVYRGHERCHLVQACRALDDLSNS